MAFFNDLAKINLALSLALDPHPEASELFERAGRNETQKALELRKHRVRDSQSLPVVSATGTGRSSDVKTEEITKNLKAFLAEVLGRFGNTATPGVNPLPPALTEKQREILQKLDGKAMALKTLAELLGCDKSRLQRDHLKTLMALGHVKNDRKVGGYYRPDAPPTMA